MHRYPEGSEHEYLLWSIATDYMFEMGEIDQLLMTSEAARLAGDRPKHSRLWREYTCASQEIHERRWRREEIVDRLYIDTLLRREGTTFADVYEREQPVSNKPF